MKPFLSRWLILFCMLLQPLAKGWCNVYVIIYATTGGKTGHSGIAIDNYQEQVAHNRTDTVRNGTLTYFDLWPLKDDFHLGDFSADLPAKFYRLPNHLWPASIFLTSLYDKGIPHKEFYPCDAILMIRTTPAADYHLTQYLDSVMEQRQVFNARYYNCSDFVRTALHRVISKPPHAREFIPFSFSTTPNKLCRKLMARKDIVIVKHPGNRVKKHFFWSRVLKRKPAGRFLTARHNQRF